MELGILGSGSAFSEIGHHAAYVVDRRLLLDCGAPVPVLLGQLGSTTETVEAVLISHLHGDHSLQLPLLIASRAINHPDAAPLRVVGPRGLAEMLEAAGRLALHDFWDQVISLQPPQVEEWSEGQRGPVLDYQVEAVLVEHSRSLHCLAFRVSDAQLSLGYSGDTTYCSGIRDLASRVDYLLCECTSMLAPVLLHLWRGEVEQLMQESPRTRFILTHLTERMPVPGAILASDGLVLQLS